MSCEEPLDPIYVLGRSEAEARRLAQQGEMFKRSTRLLFEEAGLCAGLTVLDLGCGTGDVSLLAPDRVGPTGRVVGVDNNPTIVETARQRAKAMDAQQVTFVAADLRDIGQVCTFDAIVGRFVLMYLTDPVSALRGVFRNLRSGGLIAFYDLNFAPGITSFPVSRLHQFLGRCVSETLAGGGIDPAMGWRLYQVMEEAGLTTPRLRSEALIGGGNEWMEVFAPYVANTLRSMVPMILKYGIATEEEIDIDTFEQRYRAEILRQGSVVQWPSCVGAFARKPSVEPQSTELAATAP
jgi:ubiquinone/menaquinone biosynthesis C-methylase UbiE